MVFFDRGLLNGSVHPFHFSIAPRMVDLRQAMINAVFFTYAIKDVFRGISIPFSVRELEAIVCQYRMDFVGALD